MERKIKRAEMVVANKEAVKAGKEILLNVGGVRLIRMELEDGKEYGGVIWPFLWQSLSFAHFFPKDPDASL